MGARRCGGVLNEALLKKTSGRLGQGHPADKELGSLWGVDPQGSRHSLTLGWCLERSLEATVQNAQD